MKLKRRFLGYSWLGWLNILVLQWFFIRLQATILDEAPDEIQSFHLIGFIVPLTGWWSNYIWFLKFTRAL